MPPMKDYILLLNPCISSVLHEEQRAQPLYSCVVVRLKCLQLLLIACMKRLAAYVVITVKPFFVVNYVSDVSLYTLSCLCIANSVLTLTVPVTTVDALRHFETG